MKKLFTICFLSILSLKLIACSCATTTLTNHFLSSDFVAIAEIKATYTNEKDQDFYKVDITKNQQFKGTPVTSIYVNGFNKIKNQFSSCDVLRLIPGSKWLIFANKNQFGNLITGYCDLIRADDYLFQKENNIFILQKLKENEGKLLKKYPYSNPLLSYEKYKTYASNKISNYMLVAVKLHSNLSVSKINFLTDDTETAKNRVERQIRNYQFKTYIKKYNIDTTDGFYYIFELYPYTNIVEPILKKFNLIIK